MKNYSKFSQYYDRIMGDRSSTASLLKNIVAEHYPKAETLLELACGTGAILEQLSGSFKVYGLDVSSYMLSAAKKKLPRVKLYRHDMTSFNLRQKFDVIICVFDSINHLLSFSSWKKVFNAAYKHLNSGGLFIFDMNTTAKFRKVTAMMPNSMKVDKNYLMLRVVPEGKTKACWNIKMFERQSGNNYKLYEESIREVTFPPARVKSALKQFQKVTVFDENRKRPSSRSERLVFICKK